MTYALLKSVKEKLLEEFPCEVRLGFSPKSVPERLPFITITAENTESLTVPVVQTEGIYIPVKASVGVSVYAQNAAEACRIYAAYVLPAMAETGSLWRFSQSSVSIDSFTSAYKVTGSFKINGVYKLHQGEGDTDVQL